GLPLAISGELLRGVLADLPELLAALLLDARERPGMLRADVLVALMELGVRLRGGVRSRLGELGVMLSGPFEHLLALRVVGLEELLGLLLALPAEGVELGGGGADLVIGSERLLPSEIVVIVASVP